MPEVGYRSWQELEAEKAAEPAEPASTPEVAPDGYPWPNDWRLAAMLAWYESGDECREVSDGT